MTEYADDSGTIVAHYEYDPFGNTVVQSGSMADSFTHRFSTKPWCAVTGMSEYLFRKYSPGMGRWINRDPLEESAGFNLYTFVRNRGTLLLDRLGLSVVSEIIGNYDLTEGTYDPVVIHCLGDGYFRHCRNTCMLNRKLIFGGPISDGERAVSVPVNFIVPPAAVPLAAPALAFLGALWVGNDVPGSWDSGSPQDIAHDIRGLLFSYNWLQSCTKSCVKSFWNDFETKCCSSNSRLKKQIRGVAMRSDKTIPVLFLASVACVALISFMLFLRHEETKFNVIIEQVEKCRTAAEVNRLLGKRIRHTLLSPDREDLEYFGLKIIPESSLMKNTAVDIYGVGGIPSRRIYIFYNHQSSNVIKVAHSYM